ncbi:hypothetical protein ACYPKM_01035 [Pseudomonas aeruginosa]
MIQKSGPDKTSVVSKPDAPALAVFPFTEEIEHLYERMGEIPVDTNVRFAQAFISLLRKKGGNPWGPQATARAKLATRLWFAGWTRSQLAQVGLKPKDVENFRRAHGLTADAAGRPKGSSVAPKKEPLVSGQDPISAIKSAAQKLTEKRQALQHKIAEMNNEIGSIDAELRKLDAAMKVLTE